MVRLSQYAELHCHSTFSLLDGASDPERLVERALALGLHSLALTDHDDSMADQPRRMGQPGCTQTVRSLCSHTSDMASRSRASCASG